MKGGSIWGVETANGPRIQHTILHTGVEPGIVKRPVRRRLQECRASALQPALVKKDVPVGSLWGWRRPQPLADRPHAECPRPSTPELQKGDLVGRGFLAALKDNERALLPEKGNGPLLLLVAHGTGAARDDVV